MSSDPSRSLAYASTILACISFVLVIAVYVIYWKGPVLRRRSPFAQQLSDAKVAQTDLPEKAHEAGAGTGAHLSRMPTGARQKSFIRSQQDFRMRENTGSRPHSLHNRSNPASRTNSRANSPTRRDMADAHNAAAVREALSRPHHAREFSDKDMV